MRADLERRAQHLDAVPAARVDDVLAGVDRAGRDEHLHDVVEGVVGHGEQQQVGGLGDGGRLVERRPGSSVSIRVREASDSPATAAISVARLPQRGGENGADAACADDADAKRPTHHRIHHGDSPFRSSPLAGYQTS